MKKLLFFPALILLSIHAKGQTIQEIAVGASYLKQSYVNLTAGTEKQVTNNVWDIAFSVYGQTDGGVFINESAGSGQPQLELYDANTADFDAVIDQSTLSADLRLYNAEASWANGAFNERRDLSNGFDFGWGTYNFQNHQIIGNAVYVVKLLNGEYRKFKVESLIGGTYTFKYANLDGSNAETKTISKADHAGKTLAYFSFGTGATVDVEPTTGGFDLLYCRYTTWLYDPGSSTNIPYNVTGILTGRGVKVALADGVNPATVQYSSFVDSLKTRLDIIGYDWKTFTGTGWSLDADRVFFVKLANSRVFKLQFIDFEGSSTGKAVFEKTDLGVISAVKDPAALGLEVSLYPNPVQDQLNVALDIPAYLAKDADLEVVDLQGRLITRQSVKLNEGLQVLEVPAATWTSGVHMVRLQISGQEVILGKIVKM